MNITKTPVPDNSFEPYTIHITVESYHEDIIIQSIANAQWSIPELLYRHNRDRFGLTQIFLNKLLMALK